EGVGAGGGAWRRGAEGEKKWGSCLPRFRERRRPTQADRAETTGVAGVVRTGLLFPACLKARRGLAGTAVSSAIPRSLRGRSAVPVSPRQLAADRPRPRLPARQRWADFPLPRSRRDDEA